MSMIAYKATMFLVFFNYSMMIANFISALIFPDANTTITTAYIPLLNSATAFTSNTIVATLSNLMLTAGVLALFAFSLLIPTIPFVYMFFGLSAFITNAYIWQLPLPAVFLLPVSVGTTIVYYIGISQYAGRSSLTGS